MKKLIIGIFLILVSLGVFSQDEGMVKIYNNPNEKYELYFSFDQSDGYTIYRFQNDNWSILTEDLVEILNILSVLTNNAYSYSYKTTIKTLIDLLK